MNGETPTGGIIKTYIALLRGINVGGNTSFPMVELRALCTEIGLENEYT